MAVLGSKTQQDCITVSDVLSDGPDPDADPVGYAQAQVLPLEELSISEPALRAADEEPGRRLPRLQLGDRRGPARGRRRGHQGGGRHKRRMSRSGLVTIDAGADVTPGWPKPWLFQAALASLFLAGGLLAACGASASGSAGSTGSITLYSGQHEQTTQSLVTAFEQKTGIKVNVRYDDEDTFADEIVTEESHPRGRRLLHRELAGPGVPAEQGPAGSGRRVHRWLRPRASTTRRRATGSASRPG